MPCPHCLSTATTRRRLPTAPGYRRFNCRSCPRRFNERTGSGFNDLQHPTDIVLLAVLRRLRYRSKPAVSTPITLSLVGGVSLNGGNHRCVRS